MSSSSSINNNQQQFNSDNSYLYPYQTNVASIPHHHHHHHNHQVHGQPIPLMRYPNVVNGYNVDPNQQMNEAIAKMYQTRFNEMLTAGTNMNLPIYSHPDQTMLNVPYQSAPMATTSYYPQAQSILPTFVALNGQPYNVVNGYSNGYSQPIKDYTTEMMQSNLQKQHARKWSGELHEPSGYISHLQCRFEVEQDKYRSLYDELKRLFRSKVDIINEMPSNQCNNSIQVLNAYLDYSALGEFRKYCRQTSANQTNGSMKEFITPDKQCFRVTTKGLRLSECLYFGRTGRQSNDYQLYVEGLDRMFVSQDIFKIYQDLYDHVGNVRIFCDRFNYPNKSALVTFNNRDSYQKALTESPIMIITSSITVLLRNKIYERSRGPYVRNQQQSSNEQTNHSRQQSSNNNCDINGNIVQSKGTMVNNGKNNLTQTVTKGPNRLRRFQMGHNLKEQQLKRIKYDAQNAINSSNDRYDRMKRDLIIYNKLQYQNYLSD